MRRSNKRAFTLVELMVVIAIIATLISILLPSLAAIRRNVKNTQTKVMISVLETGIEAFRADTRCGGSLPPSAAPNVAVQGLPAKWAVSPHTSENFRPNGASLLLWALAGADLLGTPGFQDVDGNGTWGDNTGGPSYTGTATPLYGLNANAGPSTPRSGPFVDISKLKLPQAATPGRYVIPAARDKFQDANQLRSPCFLDSFDQPILYYRATPANTAAMGWNSLKGGNPGIYDLADNLQITGLAGMALPGIDLGKGQLPPDGYHSEVPKYHYLAYLGEQTSAFLQGPAPNRYSFSSTIWNPNVTAVPRPYNDKSFILLSAGADGVFGTPDDLANFEVNK